MTKCTEQTCENLGYGAGGKCPTHYARDKNGHLPRKENLEPHPDCKVSHCSRTTQYRKSSYCTYHGGISSKGGDPEQYIIRENGKQSDRKCWVAECKRRREKKGLCPYHYKRARTGKIDVPDELGVKLNPPCSFRGCKNIQEYNKLCHSHNDQLRAGKELKELRDYGKYIKGEHVCSVEKCNKPAITVGLCLPHHRGVSEYKLSPQEVIELFKDQRCWNPGCDVTVRLHIDHNHDTGKVRGLLCNGCNTALGFLKEDPKRMQGLVTYLELHDA